MRTTWKFIVIISSFLLAFFLIALVCFAFNHSEGFIANIFLAQLIVFSLAACASIVYAIMPLSRKRDRSTQDVTKMVLLSGTNSPIDEYSLDNRTSALIGKSGTVCISFDGELKADEYALVNRVESCWYVERLSNTRRVGLKRAGEQYVYKLKPGVCYKLNINDIMFIENDRVLLL